MGYELHTEVTKKLTDPLRCTMLIYGEHGVGKTTLLSQMGGYFMPTEPGHNFTDIVGEDIRDWVMFEEVGGALLTQDHDWPAIIIDSLSAAWEMCVARVCEVNGMKHPAELEWSRGWDFCKKEFRRILHPMSKGSCGIIMTAQEDRENKGTMKNPNFYYFPRITGSCKQVMFPIIDFIGYMYTEPDYAGGSALKRNHYISFAETNKYYARDRSGILAAASPIKLEPEEAAWDKILEIFKGGNDDA
jgi:energy-coupling factor transporter ATP-binding protein EcfA2